mmetsp:Transcript_14230/g.15769  ORF Transcript_14230/g.15769 Transcript_14230/m.15769 type:complete len:87 (+) Transcript_14230:308-568(+)
MNPQAALDEPRFCIGVEGEGLIDFEEGTSEKVLKTLAAMGHKVNAKVLIHGERSRFGNGQVIIRDPVTGALQAGSDPRADGMAIAY